MALQTINNPVLYNSNMSHTFKSVAYATEILLPVDTGNFFELVLSGSVQLFDFIDNPTPCTIVLKIQQDATGNRIISNWASKTRWPRGIAPVLSVTPNAVDIVTFLFDGSVYYGGWGNDYK